MKLRLAPVVLGLVLAAGCFGPAPPAPVRGWLLDCSLGAHERMLAGAAWAQDCEARASHTAGQKQEVWLAANPRDPDNVVIGAKDLNPDASAHCVWNGLFVTRDGGVSWKDVLIGGPYASRRPDSPYYGYACNTDPMGTFTADGTLYWVVELYNFAGSDGFGPAGADPSNGRGIVQPGWKLVLATSHDGGDTFPDAEAVTLEYGDGVALLNDYSRVAANPSTGSVITVINTYSPGLGVNAGAVGALPVRPPVSPGWVTCSILPYRGAGQPVQEVPLQPGLQTGTANPAGLNCQAIAADNNGTVALAAVGAAGPTGGAVTAWFAVSGDDGATFGDFSGAFALTPIPGRFNESAYRTGTGFEMAFDHTNGTRAGTLYVVTAEASAGERAGDDADIYVRSSRDQARSWSEPVKVNLDGTRSHQFMPNVVVADDGSVHVFYMDKAYDLERRFDAVTNTTCGPHCFIDVTHATSLDGGATWSNERVTQVSWNGDLGKHQEDFPFIGDYTGIGASGNVVWAGFPDASNGLTTVIGAIRVERHDGDAAA
jgi:hypothetical protein